MKFPIYELPRERYPPKLLEIPDPPRQLYVRGQLPAAHTRTLAVVGARSYSEYGRDVCQKLIGGLAGHDVAVISGLALGIDSIAHEAALGAKLMTLAIPGSGIRPEVIYPAFHKELSEEILEKGGALMSEFDPKFEARDFSFPQRNRIMAGMTDATLIVECGIRSGTMITARLALDYNREVLTVPGSIFAGNSAGPHLLLQMGAAPVTSSKDILIALGLETSDSSNPARYKDCSNEELRIIEHLKSPMSRDDLLEKLDMPTSQVNSLLTILELKDLIKESGGEIYLK